MEIEITKRYYMKVVPEWYDPEVLAAFDGSLEEKVILFEQKRATDDDMYTSNLRRGVTHVQVVVPDKEINTTFFKCAFCHEDDCKGECVDRPDQVI